MLWFRFALIVLPALVVGLGYLALGSVSKPRLRALDGQLIAVYQQDIDGVDLLRGSDPLSVGIRDLVLKPLVSLDGEGRLVPGLASSWDEGQTLIFSFPDEETAARARERLAGLSGAVATRLGISGILPGQGGDLVVELARPSSSAADEILAALDEIEVLPMQRIRVDLKVGGAAEYHRHFLDEAVEGAQVRRVWLESDSSYELCVAGEITKLLEELWIYYGEGDETVEDIVVLGSEDYLDEPWVSFSLDFNRRWEDGTPITPADLLFTIDCHVGREGGRSIGNIGREILRTEIEDERTVRIVYRRPYSPGLVAWAGTRVLPAHYLVDALPEVWPERAGQEIPSSGAVVFRDLGDGQFTLSLGRGARGSFPRGGRSIRFLPAPPRMEFVASRRMGEIDIVFPELDLVEEIVKEPRAGLVRGGTGEWDLVAFNLDRSLFGSADVRRALGMAIDRERLIDEVLAGHGRMVHSIFSPRSGIEAGVLPSLYDPAAAAELLHRAGWRPAADGGLERAGRRFSLELVANEEDEVRRRTAQRIAVAWGELGIDVRTVFLPWHQMLERKLHGRDFDVLLFGWMPDPGWDLKELWCSEAVPPLGSNFFGFSDRRVDTLVEGLRRESSAPQRNAMATELQRRIGEAAPVHLLFERYRAMVIFDSTQVEGEHRGRWQDFLEPMAKEGE